MAWIILFIAGILEVAWAVGIKYTQGFTKLIPSIFTVSCMIASMSLLAIAVRNLPIGTAYAIWTGIGAVGTVILGIFLFDESKDPWRILFIVLIIIGIGGLKFLGK